MTPLILAIEPDRRQASKIAAIARNLEAELVVSESAEDALATLLTRVPDLILTPHFLSPKDESTLDDRLRQLDAAGTKVQTLVTPMLASAARKPAKTGLLTRLRKTSRSAATPDGCEPSVFAAQITEYLDRAAAERRAAAETPRDSPPQQVRVEPPVAPVQVEEAFVLPDGDFKAFTPEPEIAYRDIDPYAAAASDATVPFVEVTAVESPVETYSSIAFEPVAPIVEPPFASEASDSVADTPPIPDFAVNEAAAVPDFSLVEVEEQLAVEAVPEVQETAAFAIVDFEAPIEPVDTPGEAAILTSAAEEVVPDATAQAQGQVVETIAAFEISLDDEGWEEIDLELAVPAGTVCDVAPDLTAFVEQLEASLASAAPKTPRPDVAPPKPVAVDVPFEDEPEPSVDDYDPHSDLWMPLAVASRQGWPQLATTISVAPPPVASAPVEAPVPPRRVPGSRSKKKQPDAKPLQDEWGLFDPQQCGFAALLAKLEEVTEPTPD